MNARVVTRFETTLPVDDDHQYRTGAWQPNFTEWSVTDCAVEGELPDDLNGVYLRNTENPLHPAIGRYHPFDGDGMLHAMEFGNGTANYRNRFVRTAGFEAELAAGGPLWAGLAEPASRSIRPDGWGARTRMKDASSTDVVVHAGKALTSFYQCGDLYALDPVTLEQFGAERWGGQFPGEGVSAHPKVDEHTGELLFFNYSTVAPYMHYGVLDPDGSLAHYTPIELPGARLPHDMAFTEHYAVLNDCPMFWDPDLLARDVHAVRFYPDIPTRIGVVPRRDQRRHQVVRGRPDVRAALDQRVRRRRRGRARRLLPGQPGAQRTAGRDDRAAHVPLPRQHDARAEALSLAAQHGDWRGERRFPRRPHE